MSAHAIREKTIVALAYLRIRRSQDVDVGDLQLRRSEHSLGQLICGANCLVLIANRPIFPSAAETNRGPWPDSVMHNGYQTVDEICSARGNLL